MEPISALSLACNVLQLVEQAVKATQVCKQVYERGSLETNDSIEELAKNVTSANQDLSGELSKNPSVRNMRLTTLAKEVTDTAKELQKVLNNIKYAKGQGQGISRAFKQTIRTLIKRGSIEKIESQLKDQETNLRSGLIKAIYISCGQAEVKQSVAFAKLASGQQEIITRFLDGNSQLFNGIVRHIKASETRIIASHTASAHDIKEAVKETKTALVQQNVKRASQEAQKRLLDSLYFNAISERQDMIESRIDDFGDTFRWIFDSNANHAFVNWLRSGTGIFWISGLAASGKSSLMAFIYRHLQPKKEGGRHLQQWADPIPSKMISFFFYNPSSDPLLKSFTGFWRSLCYQLLSQDLTLFDQILLDESAPACLRSVLLSGLAHVSLTNQDLKEAFFFLLRLAVNTAKYLILVDGLDEFTDSQEHLVNALEQITRISDAVKLCCSSRPESIYQRRLHKYVSLRIQDFTNGDMRDYCRRQLGGTPAEPLTPDIIEKAQGVFLWLYLVVNDLRMASVHDSPEELEERLRECPSKMAELFSLMLRRCDPFYIKKPKPFLRLIYTATTQYRSTIYLLDLLFADIPTEQLVPKFSTGFDDPFLSQLLDRLKGLESQIVARTAGLVQFLHDGRDCHQLSTDQTSLEHAAMRRAAFIHRTAMDFLLEEHEGRDMLGAFPMPEANISLSLLRAAVANVVYFENCHERRGRRNLWRIFDVYKYAEYLEQFPETQPQLFGLLDLVCSTLARKMPDSRLEYEDFAEFARDVGMECSSPSLPSLTNLAIGCAAGHHIVKYTAYTASKIAELPPCQQLEASAILWNGIGDLPRDVGWKIYKDTYFPTARTVDALMPSLLSGQVIHMIFTGEISPFLPYIAESRGTSLSYLLVAIIKLDKISDKVIGKTLPNETWQHTLGTLLQPLCASDCSETPIQFIGNPFETFSDWQVSGELTWRGGLSNVYVLELRCTAGWVVDHFLGASNEERSNWSEPRFVSFSPEYIDKFFELTPDDSDELWLDQGAMILSGRADETAMERLLLRVLNRNMASLTDEDVQNLELGGWILKDGRFYSKW